MAGLSETYCEEESPFPRGRASLSQEGWGWDIACMRAKLLQLCLTLCDPMDHSPPGFSIHGILQARTLQWIATPGDLPDQGVKPKSVTSNLHWQVGSLPLALPGKPGNGTLCKHK